MIKLKEIISLAATTLSVVIISPCQAVTVNLVPSEDTPDAQWVESITDLIVNINGVDTSFDVRFYLNSFNELFGSPNAPQKGAYFWNNPTDGEKARIAIDKALNEVNTVPEAIVADFFGFTTSSDQYNIPIGFDDNNNNIIPLIGTYDAAMKQWTNGGISPVSPSTIITYATFKVNIVTTPEPSSLIAIMMTGCGFLLSRKGKEF
jgi:hypothetical protein